MSGIGPAAGNLTRKTSQGLRGNAIPSWSQIISKHERQMNVLSSAHDSKINVSGGFRGLCKYFQGVRAAKL